MKKYLCVSVDLDSMGCYHMIHGLEMDSMSESYLHIHYTAGLERFLHLFSEIGIHSTLFVIGQDVENEKCADVLKTAVRVGHEPANHSWSHPYNLIRFSDVELKRQIMLCHRIVKEITGYSPVGFRAPGYSVSTELSTILCRCGYMYDASVLPSPPYFFAKLAVMVFHLFKGRSSHSILKPFEMVFSPRFCYRQSRFFPWIRGSSIPEIPCSVMPVIRLPVIGTSITFLPEWLLRIMLKSIMDYPVVSLEFHAIDMLGGKEDELEFLSRYQPDLNVSVKEKKSKIKWFIETLLDVGDFIPVTLKNFVSSGSFDSVCF